MNAAVSIPNATGTYTLRVDGVGNGNPAANGWSDYASLGQYTLTSTGCATTSSSTSPTPAPSANPTPTPTPSAGPSSAPSTPSDTPSATPTPTPTTRPQPHRAPQAPHIGWVTSGARRGPRTATVRWSAPGDTGGTAVTSYRIQALQLSRHHRVVHNYLTRAFQPSVRSVVMTLPAGSYRFRVHATNAQGTSPWSAWSRSVKAQ
jgi:hypothetical protein